MPKADQLYLLFLQSKELCDNTLSKWDDHFQWLQEVQIQAKESREHPIVPKTPSRKRKIKRNDENMLPPPPPNMTQSSVRKSSRAAAKAAQEKTKRTLTEISNLGTKLRRPSSSKKTSLIDENVKHSSLKNNAIDKNESSLVEKIEFDIPKENINTFYPENVSKLDTLCKETKDSQDMPPCSDATDLVISKEKSKISRTSDIKRSLDDKAIIDPMEKQMSKKRKICIEVDNHVDGSGSVQTFEVSNKENNYESHIYTTTCEKKIKMNQPPRITRSKVRPVKNGFSPEQKYKPEQIISTLTTKDYTISSSHTNQDDSSNKQQAVGSTNEISARITRSKVCKKKNDIEEEEIKILTDTPKSKTRQKQYQEKIKSPPAAMFAGSGSASPHFKSQKFFRTAFEIQEIDADSIKVNSSPGKVIRHIWADKKVAHTIAKSSKPNYFTPSPVSSSIKIPGGKGVCSSGKQLLTYSQRRGISNSSPQIAGIKAFGTPAEGNRVKNILSGTSFLTKVQLPKVTCEKSAQQKQDELLKRKEREEEIIRKKEKLLQMKTEAQKRKNEERMKKVQDAREARERKAAEERELQEKERKLKEERKRKNLITAKKNEEMQQQVLRKQFEEELKLKELKKLEQKKEAERIAREKLEQERLREADRIAREKGEIEQLKLKEAERRSLPKNMNETYTADPDGQLPPSSVSPVKSQKCQKKNVHDYGINDICTDDSTDDESAPKKEIPLWARYSQLTKHLFAQEHFPPNCDLIFPPSILLKMPDLMLIFPERKRSRFTKRTSSAVWNTPPCGVFSSMK